jgi:heat shock protein HslJ
MNMKKPVYLILSLIVIGTLTACSLGGTPTPAPTAAPLPTPPAASPATVTGVTWEWIEFSEAQPPSVSPVPSPENYTIIFNADGTFNALADCNAAAGTYVVDGDKASLILGPVTLAECGPESYSSNFLNLLGQVTGVGMEGDKLVLVVNDGAAKMVFQSSAAPEALMAEPVGGIIVPSSVQLNTQGLVSTFQAAAISAAGYDNTQPPGPVGLPDHIEITFGEGAPEGAIIYIIPIADYQKLWEVNGDPSVTGTLVKLESLLVEKPQELPQWGLPVLPFERAVGANDIAVQGIYLPSGAAQGVRFIGRFSQDPSAVTNSNLYYVYLGLSNDGNYLIAFFYPITANSLSETASAEDQSSASQDFQAYLQAKIQQLNGLTGTDFSPAPATLDALIQSLTFTTE